MSAERVFDIGVDPTLPPPEVTVPEVTVPEVTVPEVTVPEVTVPEVTVPEVTVPEVTVPEVTVPNDPPPSATSNPPSTSTPRPPSSGPGSPGSPSEPSTSASPPTEGTSPTTGSSVAEPDSPDDSSSSSGSIPDDESTSPLPAEVAVSELDVVAAAAGLEALAVEAYTIAREAATAGSYGQVPPAIVNYLDTAYGHHRVALETWNRVLAAAGEPTVVEAPADPATAVAGQLAVAIDGAGAARVVLGVERTAAATYLNALGDLVSEPAIRLAGSMLSIDQQHISWLLFASGEYPVPETFASAQLAGTDA